jgi:hypothetical protein
MQRDPLGKRGPVQTDDSTGAELHTGTELQPGTQGDLSLPIARGIASAVTCEDGLTEVQQSLLGALLLALHGVDVDVGALELLGPEALAQELEATPASIRHRVVQDMVLGELVLRPIPQSTARRVQTYAHALGIEDRFVRVARRYAQGAFGLAWLDLHRSGFAEHWERARMDQLKTSVALEHQLAAGVEDQALADAWMGFAELAPNTLGRSVWDMYRTRGFGLPGSVGGASAYLAQHDFVHVIADYGTDLNGELEVFALIGRADPDPKGFAWLATLIGLFGTGYVSDAGFFSGDLRERRLDDPAVHVRIADALARGQRLCDRLGTDLLDLDYHELARRPVTEVRDELGVGPKGPRATAVGSPGAFDLAGMSQIQRAYALSLEPGGNVR